MALRHWNIEGIAKRVIEDAQAGAEENGIELYEEWQDKAEYYLEDVKNTVYSRAPRDATKVVELVRELVDQFVENE